MAKEIELGLLQEIQFARKEKQPYIFEAIRKCHFTI